MSQESLAVLAVAVIVLLAGLTTGLRQRRRGRGSASIDAVEQAHRAGLLERLRDVVDRSVGLYLVRRLLGRPTDRMHRQPLPALSAEEVAFRIGVPDAKHEPHARPMLLSEVAPTVSTPVRAVRPPARATLEPRGRLIRDTSAALAGLAAVALLAVAVWPPTPDGSVLSLTATPGPTAAAIVVTEAPSGAPTSTPAASPSPGPARPEPSVTPVAPSDVPSEALRPDAIATGGSVSVRPPAPRGQARPSPSPRLTPTPTPAPTLSPTPAPTPTPTPAPTPTPEPTPTPTPEPTPTTTPTP